MIEIRIRHIDNGDSVRLGYADINGMDDVFDQLARWGLVNGDNIYARDDFSGQFVLTESSAYFEILVGTDD